MGRLGWVLLLWATMAASATAGASPTAAQEARPRVIDGHTLEVGGVLVWLFGIEAPKRDQTCRVPQGRW